MVLPATKRSGFTLVELLIVIGIIALLAALLFPVFLSARAKARQAACISNLRQIGVAVFLYAQDSDDMFPEGLDPIDKYSDEWQSTRFAAIVPHLSLLSDLLQPYTTSKRIWDCPSDTGFNQFDVGNGIRSFAAHPSSFARYGMSYYYRTYLGLYHHTVSGLVGYDDFPPYDAQYGPAQINVLCDGSGAWHGGNSEAGRYDVLMGDGHVENMTYDALADAWAIKIYRPHPPAPPSN